MADGREQFKELCQCGKYEWKKVSSRKNSGKVRECAAEVKQIGLEKAAHETWKRKQKQRNEMDPPGGVDIQEQRTNKQLSNGTDLCLLCVLVQRENALASLNYQATLLP